MAFTLSAREDRGNDRSMVCVAPRDLTKSLLRGDRVAMMGEKPESLASWMAEEYVIK